MEQSKLLPVCPTKKKIRRMFSRSFTARENEILNDIIEKTRGKGTKYVKIVRTKEFILFLLEVGFPSGYSDIFSDGEDLRTKVERFKKYDYENFKFILPQRIQK